MPPTSPLLTGLGLISALGPDTDAAWRGLLAGRSGLGPLTRFHSARCGALPVAEAALPPGAPGLRSRAEAMAIAAARQALASAGLCPIPPRLRGRIGLVLGATVGGMPESEVFAVRLWREGAFVPACFRSHEPAAATDACARTLGLGGPCLTVSTACSSGALALVQAALWIENGEADLVLAGGVDNLCRLTLNGFASLLLVDPKGCRPFDANRAGMNLGEGAAFVVLEHPETARGRGAPVRAILAGWGATCDAHHVTAPDPSGRGAAAAMRAAMDRAELNPDDISYINAHGTGTRDNDQAEAMALRAVFDARLPPISSTKRAFGHTLAASGAIEAAVCVLALEHQVLPPNPGFETLDERIGFSPIIAPRPAALAHVLSNSFGFGGNNVCLALAAPDARSAAAGVRRPSHPPALPSPLEIAAIRFLSPAGHDFDALSAAAQTGIRPGRRDLEPPLPGGAAPVCACDNADVAAELDPVRHRRLTRLLQWGVACGLRCRAALPHPLAQIAPDRVGIALGTGLGGMEDTDRFLTNMIRRDEQAPMPASFVHSVHNALAARLAMELQARGLNATVTHREISFEASLWQAAHELRAGRLDLAFAGAADELNPYLLAAGRHWNWWPCPPLEEPQPALRNLPPTYRQPPCGEGMMLAALAPAGRCPAPMARLEAVAIGRWTPNPAGRFDPGREAAWLRDTLRRHGVDPDAVDLLLTGAGGWRGFDPLYQAVAEAFSGTAARPCVRATYKHLCGEFNAASALGLAVAAGLVSGRLPAAGFYENSGDGSGSWPRRVVVYTLARSGTRAMMAVSA
jgi:3-oxoacyl-(acyl-carrier-protein) synthase